MEKGDVKEYTKIKNKKYKTSRAEDYIRECNKRLPLFGLLHRAEMRPKLMSTFLLNYLKRKRPSYRGVKLLIENGAEVNTNNSEALLPACMHCSLRTVKYLLQKGARINNIGSLFIGACKYGKLPTVKYLHSLDEETYHPKGYNGLITIGNNDPVIWAANYGCLDTVIYLVNHGADISAQNGFALKLCICSGKIDMVIYILSRDVIDIKNDNYVTFALEREDIKMVNLLIKYGANVSKFDKDKYEKITGKKLETKDDYYKYEKITGKKLETKDDYYKYNFFLDKIKRIDEKSKISEAFIKDKLKTLNI